MQTAKILHLTNTLTEFKISLREADGTVVFSEKTERKVNGYPKKDLNKLFIASYKKIRVNNVTSARIVVDGLNHINVNYILQKLKEKGFGFLSIKINVISSNKIDPAKKIASDTEIEWKMIQEKLKKMEADESKFIEVVGTQPNGLLFSSNIQKVVDRGYTVRTVAMRARVKYVIIKG